LAKELHFQPLSCILIASREKQVRERVKTERRKSRRATGKPVRPAVASFPLFCDFSCPHAGFAPTQAVGACRREQAVYCAFFRELNNKHSLCLERKKRT